MNLVTNKKNYKLTTRGFTLIELLAVIIILAIVALVATPLILDVINSSKEKARLSSVYGIIDSARLKYVEAMYNNETFDDSNILDSLIVSGEKPTGSIKVNQSGEIALAVVYDGNRCYKKNYGDSLVTTTTLENGATCQLSLSTIADGEIMMGGLVVPYGLETNTQFNELNGGLYLDELDNTYRYKGTNPNNYIRLYSGNEADGLYRIIAIDNQGMKVISDKDIQEQKWRYVVHNVGNGTYCDSFDEGNYRCNAWSIHEEDYVNGDYSGTVYYDSSILSYLQDEYYNTYLSGADASIVKNASWNVGGVSIDAGVQQLMAYEATDTWTGKIGLINPSDYVRSQLPSDNASCYNGTDFYNNCKTNNWLNDSERHTWTMNVKLSSPTNVIISNKGLDNIPLYVGYIFGTYYNDINTNPVVYLSNNVVLSGEGTASSPYVINGVDYATTNVNIGNIDIPYLSLSNSNNRDGLYIDTDSNSYRYKGNNVNNYIKLSESGPRYRIVAIEEQGIKVIGSALDSIEWDSDDSLIGVTDINDYYGQNANIIQNLNTYYNNNLSLYSDKIVQNASWKIGALSGNQYGLDYTTYAQLKNQEQADTMNGKIGTLNLSDVAEAGFLNGLGYYECNYDLLLVNGTTECHSGNWILAEIPISISKSNFDSTIINDGETGIWSFNSLASNLECDFCNPLFATYIPGYTYEVMVGYSDNSNSVLPTFYISRNVTLTGLGTYNHPFVVNN